jgi:hypothetical protein
VADSAPKHSATQQPGVNQGLGTKDASGDVKLLGFKAKDDVKVGMGNVLVTNLAPGQTARQTTESFEKNVDSVKIVEIQRTAA